MKLHELLAVQTSASTVAKNIMDEARGAFKTGAYYNGHVRTTEYPDDASLNRTETKIVDDTVPAKLEHVGAHLSKLLDVMFNIDAANAGARADIVVDGALFAPQVPVGFLLTLETRLAELRSLCLSIPTQQPGIEWVPDLEQRSDGTIFKSKTSVVEFVTKKETTFLTVAAATEHHPAQIREVTADRVVGKSTKYAWTSMLSPASKSDLLGRLDSLMVGVKRARQRANSAKVNPQKVAKGLLDFVFTGVEPKAAGAITDEDAAEA